MALFMAMFTTIAIPLGLLGLVGGPVLSILAIVLGMRGYRRAKDHPYAPGERRTAIAAIATGIIGFPLTNPLGYIVIVLPAMRSAQERSIRVVCASNMKGVAISALVHARNHEGYLPSDLDILINSGDISPKQLQCPCQGNTADSCGYYYVSGLDVNAPSSWIMIFEAPGNHSEEGGHVVYCDGTVEFLKAEKLKEEVDRFRAEYVRSRGRLPRILPPQ